LWFEKYQNQNQNHNQNDVVQYLHSWFVVLLIKAGTTWLKMRGAARPQLFLKHKTCRSWLFCDLCDNLHQARWWAGCRWHWVREGGSETWCHQPWLRMRIMVMGKH
jgi:hypothetical protein